MKLKKVSAFVLVLFCAVSLFAQKTPAKNVILIIGDGMGPEHIGMLAQYAKYAPHPYFSDRKSNIEKYLDKATMGLTLTSTKGTLVTDSACSGTQISTGYYSLPGVIGMDWEGSAQTTILEKAKARGKSTGLVTDVYLQDATPASFAAHRPNRSQRDEIAQDMLNTGVDVMIGGGLKYFRPLLDNFKKEGYTVALTRGEFNNAPVTKGSKLLGLFGESEMPYVIENNTQVPASKEMAAKALKILSQNENGFFLMFEGGKIDWASHANDTAAMFKEMLAFDDAVGYIMKWAQENPGTLVVLTADHDTGGFGFQYSYLKGGNLERAKNSGEVLYGSGDTYYVNPVVFDKLLQQKGLFFQAAEKYNALSGMKKNKKNLAKILEELTGAPVPKDVYAHCKDMDCVRDSYNRSLGIVWSSLNHTSNPVVAAAYGPGQENFNGLYHTTDLNKKINKAFGQ
ncbi:alkaline phosphatase [Elusimicrobium posterum]|uniref:alkaline phosphatase n=1 Tax=Elusimicrobium posterum TaxID=3116653 RepID=UPI003C775FA9